MDLLPKNYKRFIFLTSVLTSLVITLAFNIVFYGLPTRATDVAPTIISFHDNSGIAYPNLVSEYIGNIAGVMDTGIVGQNFSLNSIVKINGNEVSTPYNVRNVDDMGVGMSGAMLLSINIPVSFFQNVGQYAITVQNGDQSSAPFLFQVKPNPVPSISSITPSTAPINTPGLTLEVVGSNFVENSIILFNGEPISSSGLASSASQTFKSNFDDDLRIYTKLSIVIPYNYLNHQETYNVTVFNPGPGGGTSNAFNFIVLAPVSPVINSINPSSTMVGKGVDLTINGSGFINGAYAVFYLPPNTPNVSNVLDSNTTSQYNMYADLPGSYLTTPGTYKIYVRNGAGGATSNEVNFVVLAPPSLVVPTITSITPSSTMVGSSPAITIQGTGFTPTSVIRWNGGDIPTTYVSPTQLISPAPSSPFVALGTFNVTVFNPGPGGGTSNAKPFTVTNLTVTTPAFVINSITPSYVTVNSTSVITINGSGFVSGYIACTGTPSIGGMAPFETTFVSSNQLQIKLFSQATAIAGSISIWIVPPGPCIPPSSSTSDVKTLLINP